MKPKFFNACGYNLSGCTALMDFVEDHEGVAYVNHLKHEMGVLKCSYSFAGAMEGLIRDTGFCPRKEDLESSLLGELEERKGLPLNQVEKVHLTMRKRVSELYGDVYPKIVAESMACLPDDCGNADKTTLFNGYVEAARKWFLGVAEHIPAAHFLDGQTAVKPLILLKNDPPGKFPLYASLIPDGVTIAVLRDPLDACFDFNRIYGKGQGLQAIEEYCNMLCSIFRTAIYHLERYEERIQGSYYVVKFEEFVADERIRKLIGERFLEGRQRVRSKFDPSFSMKNIGIGSGLTDDLRQRVVEITQSWYQAYEGHLRDRGMLLSVND